MLWHTNARTQAVDTDIFPTTQKTNALLGIEPAAPPPSQRPGQHVRTRAQLATRGFRVNLHLAIKEKPQNSARGEYKKRAA